MGIYLILGKFTQDKVRNASSGEKGFFMRASQLQTNKKLREITWIFRPKFP